MSPKVEVFPTHIADDTAPKRVVQVKHNEFAGLPLGGAHPSLDVGGGMFEDLRTESDLAKVPELRIIGSCAGQPRPTAGIHEVNVESRSNRLGQPNIHAHQVI